MNALKLLYTRLAGQPVPRIPNFDIFMAHAAHQIGQPLSRYYQDSRVLVDANLAVLEAFQLDIVQAISDPYREAADAGLEVSFPADSLPLSKTPLLVELNDLAKLRFPAPAEGRRMSDRIAAVSGFRQKVGGEVPIMGWVEGALAEAANLRGVSTLMTDLSDNPEWVLDLLEICTETEIAFARAQIEAGADLIGLGDAIASQISPRMYRHFGLPYEQRIFAAVREIGAIRACTSAATQPVSWRTWPSAVRRSSMSIGWLTWEKLPKPSAMRRTAPSRSAAISIRWPSTCKAAQTMS